MENYQICCERLGIVELDSTEIVTLNGGWIGFGREVLRAVLVNGFIEYAKEAGKAWMDFLQDNPHLFPDGPPDNSGATF